MVILPTQETRHQPNSLPQFYQTPSFALPERTTLGGELTVGRTSWMTYSLRQDLATLSGIHFYLSSRPMHFVALCRPRYSSFVARVKYRAHSPSKSTVQQWSVHVSINGFIWQHGAADLGESIQLSLECPHKYQVWGQPVSCVLYLKVDLVFNYIDVYIWWNPWISYIRTADWNECVCSSHLFGTN